MRPWWPSAECWAGGHWGPFFHRPGGRPNHPIKVEAHQTQLMPPADGHPLAIHPGGTFGAGPVFRGTPQAQCRVLRRASLVTVPPAQVIRQPRVVDGNVKWTQVKVTHHQLPLRNPGTWGHDGSNRDSVETRVPGTIWWWQFLQPR